MPDWKQVAQEWGFTGGQLKALLGLIALVFILALVSFVQSRSTRPAEATPLPIILGEKELYTGYFIVDPNTSPADSLELLPGIGRVLADRIVAFREKRPFRNEVDITDVPGIGPKLFERLRPYLKIKRL